MERTSPSDRRFLCFLLFWISFFGSAQMLVSGDAQVFVGDNAIVHIEASSASKAGIYVCEGAYITNADKLANAKIITQDKELLESAPKLADRSAPRKAVKEKKEIVPVKRDVPSYPKIELPHSDSRFTMQESASKTLVSPNHQYPTCEKENLFILFISTNYHPVNSYYQLHQSLSADRGEFSIRPPPFGNMG